MWGVKVDLGNWVESIVYGEPIRTLTWTTVFANKKSIRQSEFYSAANVGLRPEVMFEVRSSEYTGQEKLRFPITNGTEYTIIRVYETDGKTELVCSAQVGEGNG